MQNTRQCLLVEENPTEDEQINKLTPILCFCIYLTVLK